MAGRKEIPRELSIYINDKAVVNSLRGITGEITRTNNEMKNLNKNSATYDEDLKKLQNNLSQLKEKQSAFKNEIYETNTLFGKMSSILGPVATGLLAAFSIGTVISAFASAAREAFKTINDFEQGIADLSSITGAVGDDLKYLKEQAIAMGESTKGGASAVVEAYKLIASAKPELLDNVEALNLVTEAAITLAKASGLELPEAATALTDAMNQFGVDAEEATIFIDALANGAKYGAAEIPQVTEALLKFGAVAKSSNINIQESTALIELLAENGLKGAEAGTALRNVLLKLSAPDALPKEARVEMDRLGISLAYLKDKTIPIQEKLETLKPLLKDNASIVKVFGVENATAAINVISHTERLQELTSKMNDVGTASQQAEIKMDTVNNKTILLKSKYDSLVLSIGTGSGVVSGFFKLFIDGSSEALTGLIRLNTTWDDLFKKARQEGQKSGNNIFQERFNSLKGTGSSEDIARSIKTVAEKDYKILQGAYKENEAKIKDFNPYAINLGESGKDLKLKKEKLVRDILEQATIIRESGKKIIEARKQTEEESTKNTKVETDKKSEIQIEAEKKAETAREKAKAKKQALEKQQAKEEQDRILALSKSQGDLAKSELELFIATQRSKLDSSKTLTKDLVNEEINRLELIKDKQLTALAEERLSKVTKAEVEAKSAEELVALKQTIDYDYETNRQNLEFGFLTSTTALKKQYVDEQKVLQAEQLLADNELALAEADTKEQEDAIKRQQDYAAQLAGYKKLFDDKKITEEEYDRFKKAAKLKQDEMDRVLEIQKVQGTLGGLNQLAGAVGELFGQSKELAIVQAGINGAMAVTSILAQYPKFDGGFAMTAAIVAAGLSTVAQVAKITKAKAPKTPKFFYGGPTGTNALLGHDEFGPMTGIVHKNEYVIPESMTQSPRYANTISWLEQERTGRFQKFANGGETSPGVVGASGTLNSDQLYNAIATLNTILSSGIMAKLSIGYDDAKRIEELNKERLNSASYSVLNE